MNKTDKPDRPDKPLTDDEGSTEIENRVRRLRRARGLTQADLANLLGVSRQTINSIENGRYDPGLRLAFDIARIFAARIEDIFRYAGTQSADWSGLVIVIPEKLTAGAVTLRPHRASDLASFAAFLTDPEATRYMAFTPDQKTPEGAAAMMDAVISSYATQSPICSLTITDDEEHAYLGAVGGAEAGENAMEVFVTVMPEYQGQGIGAAAISALGAHLFETSGVTQLIADVVEENMASVRLFERLGYKRLGKVERAASNGSLGHRDMTGVRYMLSRSNWRKERER